MFVIKSCLCLFNFRSFISFKATLWNISMLQKKIIDQLDQSNQTTDLDEALTIVESHMWLPLVYIFSNICHKIELSVIFYLCGHLPLCKSFIVDVDLVAKT